MNIPTADTIIIHVNPAVILTDSSNTILHINTEPRKLINQTAILDSDYIENIQQHTSRYNSNFSRYYNVYNINIFCVLMFLFYLTLLFIIISILIILKYKNE